MPTFRPLPFVLLATLALTPACRPKQPQPARLATTAPTTAPSTQPTTRPILDARRGAGGFPLSADHPITSPDALVASLRDGYLARLTPANDAFVTLAGPFPTLDLLRIDVTDAQMRPNYRPAEFTKEIETQQALSARRLEYVATPLRYDAVAVHATLTATDATLHVLKDSRGTRGLILAGARDGRMTFHASTADFSKLLSVAPRRAGGDASKLTVLQSALAVSSPDPHTLSATLELRARYLLFPFAITFHGTLSATPDGTVTFSNLHVTGHDPGGLLVAPLLNPPLQKLNQTSRPLLSFPDPQTRITNVQFATPNDTLSLTITFGQPH